MMESVSNRSKKESGAGGEEMGLKKKRMLGQTSSKRRHGKEKIGRIETPDISVLART